MHHAQPTIRPVIDLRRKLASGDYPVRIQLYHNGQQHFVATKLRASKSLYDQSQAKRPKPDAQKLKDAIQTEVTKCHTIIDALPMFSIDAFRKLFNSESGIRRKNTSTNLNALFQEKIDLLKRHNKFNTSGNYNSARNNIMAFAKSMDASKEDLMLEDVTFEWLNAYKQWNETEGNDNVPDPHSKRTAKRNTWPSFRENPVDTKRRGNKPATVNCYLRCLKSIYNDAMNNRLISPVNYPFGKKKFTLGSPQAKKNVLTKEQLRILHDYNGKVSAKYPYGKYNEERDLWFTLYFSNGMNTLDLLHLKKENIHKGADGEEFFRFIRQKTKDSSDVGEIEVHIKPHVRTVMNRYMVKGNNYVFNVLNERMSPEQKHTAVIKWKGNVNQRLKALGKILGFHINLQMSRSTFATEMRNSGVPTSFLSRLMGHSNQLTTEHYLASLPTANLISATDNLNAFLTERDEALVKGLEKIVRKILLPNVDKKTAKRIMKGEDVKVPINEISMERIMEALRQNMEPKFRLKAV